MLAMAVSCWLMYKVCGTGNCSKMPVAEYSVNCGAQLLQVKGSCSYCCSCCSTSYLQALFAWPDACMRLFTIASHQLVQTSALC